MSTTKLNDKMLNNNAIQTNINTNVTDDGATIPHHPATPITVQTNRLSVVSNNSFKNEDGVDSNSKNDEKSSPVDGVTIPVTSPAATSSANNKGNVRSSSIVQFALPSASSSIKTPPKSGKNAATSRVAVTKLWVVVVMTIIQCVVLMVAEHLTHSLTLRVEAYHSLYNAVVLIGSLISIKLCQQPESLQNTFGWARIDVVLYLVSLIFLSSLCFSVAIEAAQTALHIHHQDPIHYPDAIIYICLGALTVNAVVFILIGGYTQHQGSFCELRGSGDVYISKQVREDSLQRGQRTLSARNQRARTAGCPDSATLRQGYRDVLRDISGIMIALLCAVVLVLQEHEDSLLSYYMDPLLAVVSVTVLMWLSYPFGKECSKILLQTIPDHIDVSKFSETLQDSFPDILNVHHLHIWSLRPGHVVATVHVIFADKNVYLCNSAALAKFFEQHHISQVTLQPEFLVAEMATLPYCRCADHLLDEAEDICDDYAMTHKDIHLHLHDQLHEHHHDDEHHCHHDHEHKHNHEHKHTHNDLELPNPTFDKHACDKKMEPASDGGKCGAPNEQLRQNQRENVKSASSLCKNNHESNVLKHGCHESSVEKRCVGADANNANGSNLVEKKNSGNCTVGKNLNNKEEVQFMAPQTALEKLQKENYARNSENQIRGSDSNLSHKLNLETKCVANKCPKSDCQNLEESKVELESVDSEKVSETVPNFPHHEHKTV
ncbi:probable zinc transporter protein DDB_G0269332 [Hyalella azteca]|uniref:Probable zinc transporter protein DDB_G0269332 n=1 Tax=Hyalella azteca TaxID=294128 RepID=A0A8B7P7H6_HYAAZ|nr:probable zinc transporter protein DDB_G0269332 [Hyalella azteca]